MTITPERAEVLHFSPPTTTRQPRWRCTTNSSITEAADLGKKVGVCAGCTYDLYLQNKLQIAQDASGEARESPRHHGSGHQDLRHRLDGDTGPALGDGRRLDAVISALPTLEVRSRRDAHQDRGQRSLLRAARRCGGSAPSSDPTSLVERISEIVDEMKEDRTLEELSAEWYGTNLTVAPRPTS